MIDAMYEGFLRPRARPPRPRPLPRDARAPALGGARARSRGSTRTRSGATSSSRLAAARVGGGRSSPRGASRACAPVHAGPRPLPRLGGGVAPRRLARAPPRGPAKLLGVAMLVALFVVTSDMMGRPGMPAAVGRTLAATSLLTAARRGRGRRALAASGRITPLVGTCGDLLPGPALPRPGRLPAPEPPRELVRLRLGRPRARGRRALARLAARVQAALGRHRRSSRPRARSWPSSSPPRSATPRRPARRRLAGALAAVLVLAMVALTVVNVTFYPLRPWDVRVLPGAVARASRRPTTSLETLAAHPLVGTGPGTSPGRRGAPALRRAPHAAQRRGDAGAARARRPRPRGRSRCGARARGPTDLATWGMLAGLAPRRPRPGRRGLPARLGGARPRRRRPRGRGEARLMRRGLRARGAPRPRPLAAACGGRACGGRGGLPPDGLPTVKRGDGRDVPRPRQGRLEGLLRRAGPDRRRRVRQQRRRPRRLHRPLRRAPADPAHRGGRGPRRVGGPLRALRRGGRPREGRPLAQAARAAPTSGPTARRTGGRPASSTTTTATASPSGRRCSRTASSSASRPTPTATAARTAGRRGTAGRLVSEELDTDGDGRPDRRLVFGPRARLLRVERLPR